MSNLQHPRISIIVVTFNSANFILETLESVKRQTHRNIELIISDDRSTDDTCEIILKWLSENDHSFQYTSFIQSKVNHGIVQNCLSGLHKAKGEWVKFIAGDDLLPEDAIESVIKYLKAKDGPLVGGLLTDEIRFSGKSPYKSNYIHSKANHPFFSNPNDSKKQLEWLLLGVRLSGASLYYKKSSLLMALERAPAAKFLEDILFTRALVASDFTILNYNKPTYFYRQHNNSFTAEKAKLIYPRYYKEEIDINCFYLERNKLEFKGIFWLVWRYRRLRFEIIRNLGNSGKIARSINWILGGLDPTPIISKVLKYSK